MSAGGVNEGARRPRVASRATSVGVLRVRCGRDRAPAIAARCDFGKCLDEKYPDDFGPWCESMCPVSIRRPSGWRTFRRVLEDGFGVSAARVEIGSPLESADPLAITLKRKEEPKS